MDAALSASVFRHEALLYAGADDFVRRTSSFIRDALAADEPVLVTVSAEKIALLRAELRSDAETVLFADMADVGHNPARIIPAWRDLVTAAAAEGRRPRGIGEPIWDGRRADELVECQRHESLLNVAFDDAPGWWLVCPYDTETLSPAVLEEARRSHPYVVEDGVPRESPAYRGVAASAAPFEAALSEPSGQTEALTFVAADLARVRSFVADRATALGMPARRVEDFVLAVNEVATNSVRHGGGRGNLRMWQDGVLATCEVRDRGTISGPLVGRERPDTNREAGFGIWLANQLCDLVQIRSVPDGSVVRLHMAIV